MYKKGEKRNYFKNNFENEITNKRLYSQRASVNYERTAKNYNHLCGGKQVKKLVLKKKTKLINWIKIQTLKKSLSLVN